MSSAGWQSEPRVLSPDIAPRTGAQAHIAAAVRHCSNLRNQRLQEESGARVNLDGVKLHVGLLVCPENSQANHVSKISPRLTLPHTCRQVARQESGLVIVIVVIKEDQVLLRDSVVLTYEADVAKFSLTNGVEVKSSALMKAPQPSLQ